MGLKLSDQETALFNSNSFPTAQDYEGLLRIVDQATQLGLNVTKLRKEVTELVRYGHKLSPDDKPLLDSKSFPTDQDYKGLLRIVDQAHHSLVQDSILKSETTTKLRVNLQTFVEKGYTLLPAEQALLTPSQIKHNPLKTHKNLVTLNENLTKTITTYKDIDRILSHLKTLKKRYDHPDQASQAKLKILNKFIEEHKKKPNDTIEDLSGLQQGLATKRKLGFSQMFKHGFGKTGLDNIEKKIRNDKNMTQSAKQKVLNKLSKKKGPSR